MNSDFHHHAGLPVREALSALRWRQYTILALSFSMAIGLAVLFHLTPEPQMELEHLHTLRAEWLYQENGIYESAAVVMLLGVVVVALAGLREVSSTHSRVHLLWLSAIALLACARELDMQVLIRPEYLGSMGTRLRLDWWIESGPPLWLKAFWGSIFGAIALVLLLPVLIYRKTAINWRQNIRDPSLQLLALTVVLWGLGFTFDDLLRRVDAIPMSVKQTFEECAECCGSICLLLATIGYVTVPISARYAKTKDPA